MVADAVAMTRSYFVGLGQNSGSIRRWEESEGLIQFFQGNLTAAVNLLTQEAQTTLDPTLVIVQVRSIIELAETYHHLMEIESYLIPQWLSYERGRPNAKEHLTWYHWIELVALTHVDSRAKSQTRINQLKSELVQSSDMKDWEAFALDIASDVPSLPKRPASSYQRWVRFARAVKQHDLDRARKLFNKLKLKKPMLKVSGDSGSSLKIYDPRVTRSLRDFYILQGLDACKKVQLGGYYCGRLHEIQGSLVNAQADYRLAQKQLSTLISDQKTILGTDHVVLSVHTELSGIRYELEARLARLATQTKTSPHKGKTLSKPEALVNQPLVTSTDQQEVSRYSLSTHQMLWRYFQDPQSLEEPHLFPTRRGALSLLASTALESSKGAMVNDVATFELIDRWLDEMHYRYAHILILRDDRVSAMKVLNASEEVKFGARLGGRNRLARLLLSAYTYLKMNQQRVTVKYLRRLQKDLPALSFALGMTSDVLSGKSFEQKEGNVTSGQ